MEKRSSPLYGNKLYLVWVVFIFLQISTKKKKKPPWHNEWFELQNWRLISSTDSGLGRSGAALSQRTPLTSRRSATRKRPFPFASCDWLWLKKEAFCFLRLQKRGSCRLMRILSISKAASLIIIKVNGGRRPPPFFDNVLLTLPVFS